MLEHRDRTVIAAAAGRKPCRIWIRWLALAALLLMQSAWSQQTCTWNVNGPGLWGDPANWNGCSGGNGSPAGTPGPADHALIGNIAPLAAVDLGPQSRTLDQLTLSAGRIFGNVDLTITTRLEWAGGTIDGGGNATLLTLDTGSNSEIAGGLHILAKRDLRNLGNLTWASGDIVLNEDAEIDNQGVLVIDTFAPSIESTAGTPPVSVVLSTDGSPLARLHNSSTPGAHIRKQGGGSAQLAPNLQFDNGNDVFVDAGRLQVMGGGGDFGAYSVVAPARLEFGMPTGVTRDLTGSSAVGGNGLLHKFGQGTLNISGGYALTGPTEVVDGTLYFDTPADPLDLPSLRVRAPGVLTGLDNLRVGTTLVWEGGDIGSASPGLLLTLPGSASATIVLDNLRPAAFLRSRNLVNLGELTLGATASVTTHLWLDGASIDNQGIFNLNNNSAPNQNLRIDCLSTDCGSFFNRAGATVNLVDQQGIVAIGSQLAAFDNAGLVELAQGCGAIGAPGTDTGTWRYAGSCTLWFNPRPDTERVLQSAVTLDPIGATSLQLGGSVRINGASRSFGNLIIDPSATLFGPAAMTFTGITEWRGLIEGVSPSETVTVASGAALVTSGNPLDTPLLFGRTLFNDGDINIADVRVQLDGNAEIRNNGLLNLLGSPVAAGAIGCASPPLCGLVTNTSVGSIQSTAAFAGPPNVLEADVSVVNQGALRVDNGVLVMESPYTATSGSFVEVFAGAGLRRTVGNLVLAAGSLRGAGVIDASVDTDQVDIQPGGVGTGNLAILGNFSATSNTQYQMGVAGTAPPAVPELGVRAPVGGPSYDRLTISGSASLAGTLDVIDLGHPASPGDAFDLMLYSSHVGNVVAGANPYSLAGLSLQTEATRIRLAAPGGALVCTWNPGGAGADVWSNPSKWNTCGGGVPGASDTAIVGTGTVDLDTPVSVGSLQFTGGLIFGANDLAIITELIWTGGTFQGASGSLVTTTSGTLVSISGGQHTIDGRTFVLNSAANWTTGLIELANAGVLEITATGALNSNPNLNFESIFGSGVGVAEVRNDGVINKLGPNFSGIGDSVQYSGAGNIVVTAGEFVFAATSASTLDADYSVDAGATLQFVGGDRSFGASATLGGPGNLVFGDSSFVFGINTVDGCIDTGSTVFIRNATVALNCASPTTLASLLMTDPFAVLEGSSAVSISGHFGWAQGLIRGSGSDPDFVLDNSATSTWSAPLGGPVVTAPEGIPSGRRIQNRRFVNHGAITWEGGAINVLLNGGVFENAGDGSLVINVGGGFCDWDSDASAGTYLVNNGLIDWVSCFESYVSPPFDNNGTLQMANGTLYLFESGNDTGDYLIGAGAAVRVVGPGGGGRTVWRSNRPTGPVTVLRTLSAAGSISGAGTWEVSDLADSTISGAFSPATAATRFDGILRIDSASPATVTDLIIDFATLTGSAPIQVAGSFDWQSGSLAGTGASPIPLVLLPGSTSIWEGSGVRLMDNRALQIQGALNWQAGQIQVPGGASATLLVDTGGELVLDEFTSAIDFACVPATSCSAALTINGTLRQIGDDVLFGVTQPVSVGGNLQVEGNVLTFPGLVQNGGLVNVVANATLDVGSYTLSGGTLSGRGTVNGNVDNFAGLVQPGGSPGQLNIAGNYSQGGDAALQIQLAGLTPDVNADYLAVTGQATLAGALNVVNAGYSLTPPETYEFLSAGSGVVGTFNAVNNDYAGYAVTYNANSAVLTPAGGPLVVNSVGDAGDGICDAGECTLRDALVAANLSPDPDVIAFNIPSPQCTGPGGACVIEPSTPLPAILTPIVIDGYTQPGAVANSHAPGLGLGSNAVLKIELSGALAGGGIGLAINAPSSIVSITGLALYRWGSAIVTQGPGDATYQIGGNFIGLRADGSVAPAPQLAGISIQGGSVFIGNGGADKMNVISGNQQQGISITAVPVLAGVSIRGNLIGTTVDGLAARPNGLQGILLSTPSQIANVFIGGNLPDYRNVISGNAQDGIRFDCSATVGNCFDGTRVLGNFIGPAADGSPLGNLGNGVNLTTMDGGRVFIGDVNPGEGNRIAFNGGNGILATFGGVGRASFVRNDIYLNGQMGIDLGGDGRTANDDSDLDTGTNGLLNFPTFTSYTAPGGTSAVIEVILGTPDIGGNYPARVDFYKATEDEPSVWLGTTTCAAPGVTCPASFAFPGGVSVAPGDVVLGIVTDGFGKSSEASFYATTTTVSAPDSTIGTPYLATVEVTSGNPFTALGDVDVDDGLTESCIATLAEVSPGVASGSCLLDAVAPAGARTLTASYAPETAPPRPFSNSSGTDAVLIGAAAAPPVLSLISPSSGPVAGGTVVTLTGSNFVIGSTSVSFGSLPAAAVNCTSTTECTATSPAGTGTAGIRVTTVDGTSVDTLADDFTWTVPTLCTNLAPSSFVATGAQPRDIALGDFDGNGTRDFATVNSTASGTVSVLLGTGTGAFAPAVDYPVAPFPRAIAVGDFNSDGVSDLVTANYGANTVSILAGTGTGSFGAAADVTVGLGPHAVAVGDFNADGRADLAVALLDLDSVAILLGNGNGSFGAPSLTSALRSVSIGVSDFDRDGNSDVAVGNQTLNAASVVRGNGAGGFGAPASFPVGTSPSGLVAADFNGDGVSDLAVSNRGSSDVSILLGDGAGGFGAASNLAVAAQPTAVDAGDFNGDGALDLAVSQAGAGTVALLLGSGTGTFAAAAQFAVGSGGSSVAFGDFNGDNRVDIAVANEFVDNVSILRNLGCAPTITSISPASGPEAGGTVVTLTGSDFAIGATSVAFGASAATAVNCLTSSQCEATSPAGTGVVNVSATTAAGTSSDTAADDFTYVPAALPIVNSTADPGNGTCDLAECTLREAIALANLTLAPSVTFDPAVFNVPRTITLSAGELVSTQDLAIVGPTAAQLVISGAGASRILYASGVDLSLSNLGFTGGNSTGSASPGVGGAILHTAGDLALTDVVLSGNSCTAAGTGGALAVTFGNLIATRLSVTGNSCANVGGIYLQDGDLTLSDASLTGNSGSAGEALRVAATSGARVALLTNVTISDNSTSIANSAIRSEPQTGSSVSLTLTNVTVSGNTTTNAGSNGAVSQHPSGGTHTTVLHNTIVAGNTVGGLPGDVTGTLDPSSSFNVIGSGGGLSNGINGNQTGINNPLLAPLSNYGGSTLTRALLPGSPAINAGSNGLATNADQRGFARPQQGTVDVGAFESQGFVLSVVSGTPQTAPVNSAFALPLVVGVVANAGGEPVDGGQVTYSAPGAGATATFTNPAVISGGQAAMAATANAIVGSYAVTAGAAGATGAPSFALTNGCPPTIVSNGNDSGAGSLRQIIADACAGSVVTFAGGVAAINLTSAELVIAKDLTIDGGAGVTVARQPASPGFRIFRIDTGNTVVLDSLTISNGNIADDGAGILNFGNLSVLDSVLSGNASTAGNGGGGIANYATLAVDNTTIALNSANFAGGGVVQINGGTATISRSTLSGNSAPQGAAVLVQSVSANSSMTISNSTISGNSATLTGSGLANFASGAGTSSTLTVTSSTIADNDGPVGAIVTGVNAGAASITLRNNIYAGNSANNVNADAPAVITSLGNNLSDDATGGGGPGDLLNADPLLAPLANHGGTTETHALLPGSPAIDAGSNADAPATDQRGVARPQLAAVDIGAFESQGFVLSLVSGTPQTAVANSVFALPLVVGVAANAAGEPVDGGQVSYSAPVAGASASFASPATIAGGQASVVATANGILGSYSVTASAPGATGAPSFALTNGTAATTTTITSVLPAPTVVGQPYLVTVGVSSGIFAVTAGIVEVRQLSDGGLCTIDLASASSCQLVGSSAITTAVRATFLGSGGFAPSQSNVVSHIVERAGTAITIVSDTPDPSPVGAPITVTVDLDVVAPGAGVATGEILVTDGIASCTIVLPNLACELAAKAVGAATLEARYLGDANFNPSLDTEPHTFSADGADLAIIKRNGLRLVPGGIPSTYILLVTNAGPQAVVNARVVDILPAQFGAASWTCTASTGASCPASGTGTVDTLVNMAAGSTLTFALTATAQASPEQIVTNLATVTPPANAPDPVPGNNQSIDVDPIGIFGEGFETEDE